jgi:hypothetical protein
MACSGCPAPFPVTDTVRPAGPAEEDRLPLRQAALIVAAVSVALWLAIGFGMDWLLG